MHSLRPRAFATILAVTAVFVTGCGSATQSSQSTGSAADAVPADALAYLDVNLDRGSAAWKQFVTVGERFPGWQHVTDEVAKELAKKDDGQSFRADVEPWLGGQAAVALTGLDEDGVSFVAFVASTDDEAAQQSVAKGKDTTADGEYKSYSQFRDKDGYTAVGNGALLFANDEATLHTAIDAREGTVDSLADDATFTAALDALPGDSLARGWANTAKLAQLASLASLPGVTDGPQALQIQQFAEGLGKIQSATFALWATDGGFNARINVTAKDASDGLLDGVTFSSSLSDLVPSDAFGFLAFKSNGQQFEQQLENPAFTMIERQTGISIADDIVPLFTGEGVLYAGPGLPFRGALMLDPANPEAAKGALTRLVGSFAKLDGSIRVTELPGGGQQVELAPGFALFWRQVPGGPLVLGNDDAAGAAPASALLDSPAYRSLLEKAGVGDGTVSFYLDVPSTLSFLPELPADARPVGGIALWSTKSGNTASTNLFVEIKG